MSNMDLMIQLYVDAKIELDERKKVADKYNKELKDLLQSSDMTEYSNDRYKINLVTSERSSMDEDLLLKELINLKDKFPGLIKSKEYVDMDELESLMYANDLDDETLQKIDKCITIKRVTQLRLSRQKGE